MNFPSSSLFLLGFLAACAGPAGEPGKAGPAGDPGLAGDPGPAGSDGATALVSTSEEPAGSNCPDGGVRLDYGVDTNGDGTLGTDEIDGTEYVCDGADAAQALVESAEVFEPTSSCPQGYSVISIGVDDGADGGTAHDGVLQEGEVRAELTDCLAEDLDADGWQNLSDNCPSDENADQADGDLDRAGDVCDDETSLAVYGISRGSGSVESNLYRLDLSANTAELIGATGHALIALKANPVDGKLYGITRDGDVGECDNCLVELDVSTGAATQVVTYDRGPVPSIAFLSDGSLYGWTENDDTFVSMGTDGVLTTLGDSVSSWGHGMCADGADRVYWINGSGETYRIDTTDGTRTFLGEIEATVPEGSWYNDNDEYGVRGDCHPESLLYVGVDITYGSAAAQLVIVQLSPDGPPRYVRHAASPIEDLHGVAILN